MLPAVLCMTITVQAVTILNVLLARVDILRKAIPVSSNASPAPCAKNATQTPKHAQDVLTPLQLPASYLDTVCSLSPTVSHAPNRSAVLWVVTDADSFKSTQ